VNKSFAIIEKQIFLFVRSFLLLKERNYNIENKKYNI